MLVLCAIAGSFNHGGASAHSPTPIVVAQASRPVLSDADVAALIVKQSREDYYKTGHPCACPDDLMRNGHRCGATSAYIRPRGAQPLCSAADVSPEMISRYRAISGHGARN